MIIFLLCRISWPRGAEGFTVAEAADVCWWGKKKKRTEKMKYTHGPELRRRCMAAWPPALSLSLCLFLLLSAPDIYYRRKPSLLGWVPMIRTHEGSKSSFLNYRTGFYGQAQASQAAYAVTKYTFSEKENI